MDAQGLRRCYAEWFHVYSIVHGPMTDAEAEISHEVASFLITCAETDERLDDPHPASLLSEMGKDEEAAR